MNPILKKLGLTKAQVRQMLAGPDEPHWTPSRIRKYEACVLHLPCTINDISDASGLTPHTVWYSLTMFERWGLVEHFQYTAQGAMVWRITQKGSDHLRGLQKHLRDFPRLDRKGVAQ
jgi:predicted transcriptional regulator